MRIEPIDELDEWVLWRELLWPEARAAEHREELREMVRQGRKPKAFLARDEADRSVGFAEATVRRDYVNGCDASPVVFLEGIYVMPESRRRGAGAALCAAVAAWGRSQGCLEFGSDALLANEASHEFHKAVGFAETERVVYFRMALPS